MKWPVQIKQNCFLIRPIQVMRYANKQCKGIKKKKQNYHLPKQIFKTDCDIFVMRILMENEHQTKHQTLDSSFDQVYLKDVQPSGLLTCKCTFWNQSKTMRIPKDSSGTSKRAQTGKKGNFQRNRQT